MLKSFLATVSLCAVLVANVQAANIHVAVAANFTAPAKQLASLFEKETGHKVILSFGGTGVLYGQIKNGAPYDVLLAADAKTPAQAVKEGYGVSGTNETYALGKLILWSADAGTIQNGEQVLKQGRFARCAVANPKLAPYGAAAYETMKALGVFDATRPKFVEGDSVGKAYQFVKTGNADIGFVALSHVVRDGKLTAGSGWVVPEHLYEPIKQNAVLLTRGGEPAAAREFLAFLRGSTAKQVKAFYGYGLP